ncbi:hypothetical protein [Nodularia chucula]|uniref:hypothetical protein n=1 Tax=Nodularia chucula TaxID=3093667 RepID=UPI0039C6A9C3
MAIEINPSTPTSPIPTVNGISVIWLGEWQSTKIYRRNQGVFHDGSSYRASRTTTEEPSLTALDWDLLAQGGDGAASDPSPSALNELTDVNISLPVDGQSLVYNSTTQEWVNDTITSESSGIPISEKGTPDGVATLDITGKIPDTQIPNEITRDTELNAALVSKADSSTTNSHISSTSNPHSVTASQVGNTTAQWNANWLQGRIIQSVAPTNGQILSYSTGDNRWNVVTPPAAQNLVAQWNANQLQSRSIATTAPSDGQVLTYSSANTRWEPQTISGGGGGGAGKVVQVLYGSTSTAITINSADSFTSTGLEISFTPTSLSNFLYITGVLNNPLKSSTTPFTATWISGLHLQVTSGPNVLIVPLAIDIGRLHDFRYMSPIHFATRVQVPYTASSVYRIRANIQGTSITFNTGGANNVSTMTIMEITP